MPTPEMTMVWYGENIYCCLADRGATLLLASATGVEEVRAELIETFPARLTREAEWIFKNLGETDREGIQRYEDSTIRLELDPLDGLLLLHTAKGSEVMVCRAGEGVRIQIAEFNQGFPHIQYAHQLFKRYAPQV